MACFVLVYNSNDLTEEKLEKLEIFKQNLVQLGIILETSNFSVGVFSTNSLWFSIYEFSKANPDIKFIKIIPSEDVITKYALVCEVFLACKTFEFRARLQPPPKIMATPLTDPNEEDEIYRRAP